VNRNLNSRLSNVKSNIDNRVKPWVRPEVAGMKSQLRRQDRSRGINDRNEQLLEKIYKIFTRKRPAVKGFDAYGRPHRLPEYGECSLNRRIRTQETLHINQRNQQILRKLQNVKPKVVSSEQCD